MSETEIVKQLEAGWEGRGDYNAFGRAHASALEQFGEDWINEKRAEWEARQQSADVPNAG